MSRSAEGATIIALLPPSSRIGRPNRAATLGPTIEPMRVEPVAETIGTRFEEASASPIAGPPMTSWARPSGASGPKRSMRALEDLHRRQRRERRLLRRLPDHRIAADERQRRVPGPDRDREIEGGNDRARPHRMPGLGHAMAGALRGDGETVQLPREADGEVADVDHLLHFAEALGDDLADLERHQRAQGLLRGAQFLAKQAHQFAPPRRGNLAPGEEGALGALDDRRHVGGRRLPDPGDLGPVDRRADGERAARQLRRCQT